MNAFFFIVVNMIECLKCKALNTKESVVCGNCGSPLEKHEGMRYIKLSNDNKDDSFQYTGFDILLWYIVVIMYALSANVFLNGIIGIVFYFIGKRKGNFILQIIGLLGVGVLGGYIALVLILSAWGF